MKKIYQLAALATLTFTGCDYFLPGNQELISYKDYSSDYEGDKLILMGYISDCHGVFADVRHSVRPETPRANDSVPDAEVVLLRDGEPLATLHNHPMSGYGPYVGSICTHYLAPDEVDIETGHTYSLRATSPTYGTAQSEPDALPTAARVDSAWATTYRYDSTYMNFNVAYTPSRSGQTVHPMIIQYSRGKAIFYKLFNYDNMTRCISTTPTWTSISKMPYPNHMDSVSVVVATFSDQTADYLQSQKDYDESLNDDTYDYPLAISQNVSGGYGFVGAYATSALTIVADSVNSAYDEHDDWYDTYDYYYGFSGF